MDESKKEEIVSVEPESEVKENTIDQKNAEDKKDEPIDFLLRIVPEHRKVSREVTESDVERVIEEAKVLFNICYSQNGPYNGALAMAHPQIDDKDPLRFFVTASAELIINPVIVRRTKTTIDSVEGCYTYPSLPPLKTVQRSNKIEVEYQTIEEDGKLSRVSYKGVSGKEAKVWQHEIGHLDAVYIYDNN